MTFTVINQLQGGEPFPGTGTAAAAPVTGNTWFSIAQWAPWAAYVDWQVTIGAVTGSPTSGVYTGRFQVWVPNRLPNQDQEAAASSGWQDVDAITNPDMFTVGGDWPQLSAYNSAVVKTTMRRIITPHSHRLVITSTLAGGSNPGAPLAVRTVAVPG